MRRFSASTRISVGVTCLTLSLVLAAQGLGIIPNAGIANPAQHGRPPRPVGEPAPLAERGQSG